MNPPIIGYFVYWSLTDQPINADRLKTKFKKFGLDEKYLPPVIRGDSAFYKALTIARKEFKVTTRMIRESLEEIMQGVAESSLADNGELAVKTICYIRYSKMTSAITSSGLIPDHPLVARVQELYASMTSTYLTLDLLRMLAANMVRLDAVCLRDKGGIYFVPAYSKAALIRLAELVRSLDDSEFVMLTAYGDDLTCNEVGKRAINQLQDSVCALREEIKKFENKPPRLGTLERRIRDYPALKDAADRYADLLGIDPAEIKTGVDECLTRVKHFIDIEKGLAERQTRVLRKTEVTTRQIRRVI